MKRKFESFAATEGLADAELRELAMHGEPHDQVLACWRLLVKGQAIQTLGADGPDAGIRRLLLLNLAVSREVELLARLACGDPDPTARQEALVLLVRLDPERGLACLRTLLVEGDDDALLMLLEPPLALPWDEVSGELERLLEREAVGLRRVAVDRLLAGGRVPEVVRRAAVHERDASLRAHIVARWAASQDHASLLAVSEQVGAADEGWSVELEIRLYRQQRSAGRAAEAAWKASTSLAAPRKN